MNFAEKLELLMNITSLSNSTLARYISVDASAISRLRRGIRNPARKATYIEPMAQTFARMCKSDYQKIALKEAIKLDCPGFIFTENDSLESIIYEWLNEDKKDSSDSLDEFMHNFINFQFKKESSAAEIGDIKIIDYPPAEINAFYGKEGKQKAVLTFLSLVLESSQPQTLYLYSDEDIEWLVDPQFRVKWAALMVQIITGGHHIKIIHNVARNFDEMLSGINEWLPLYMTGVIEPYYYPKTRDGLFRQTIFIASETAAITSSSVSNNNKNTPNLLITDKTMVRSLIEEFSDFLALCRPLMHIFTPYNRSVEYLALLEEFEGEISNAIIKTDALSCITMPPAVIESIFLRVTNLNQEKLIAYHLKRIDKFNKKLQSETLIEIMSIHPLEDVIAEKVPVDFSDMLNDIPLFYTPSEYLKHLKNIIKLLKSNENYHVIITPKKLLAGSMVYVKEDIGVLVGKTSLPSAIFALNGGNMTAAFWDYMNTFIMEKSLHKTRTQTIAKLEKIVKAYSDL